MIGHAYNGIPLAAFAHIRRQVTKMLKMECLRQLLLISTAKFPKCPFRPCPQPKPEQLRVDFLSPFMSKTLSKYNTPTQNVKRICVWGAQLGLFCLSHWFPKHACGRMGFLHSYGKGVWWCGPLPRAEGSEESRPYFRVISEKKHSRVPYFSD